MKQKMVIRDKHSKAKVKSKNMKVRKYESK